MTESDVLLAEHPVDARSQPSPQSPVAAAVPRGIAAAAGGLAFLVMTTVLLQTRRLAGGIPADLPPLAGVLLTALMAACTVAACRKVRRPYAAGSGKNQPGEAATASFLLTVLLCSGLPLAAGLSLLPAGSTVGLTVVLLLSAGAGSFAALPPGWLLLPHNPLRNLSGLSLGFPAPREQAPVDQPPSAADIGLSPAEPAAADQASALPTAFQNAGPDQDPAESHRPEPSAIPGPFSAVNPAVNGASVPQEADDLTDPDETSAEDEGRVIQWTRRMQDDSGTESVVGSLQTVFPPGQRTHLVHLVFSPPLTAAPSIECEVISETELRCKVAASMPWGARIELRRSAAAASAETGQPLELEYFATSACRRAA